MRHIPLPPRLSLTFAISVTTLVRSIRPTRSFLPQLTLLLIRTTNCALAFLCLQPLLPCTDFSVPQSNAVEPARDLGLLRSGHHRPRPLHVRASLRLSQSIFAQTVILSSRYPLLGVIFVPIIIFYVGFATFYRASSREVRGL